MRPYLFGKKWMLGFALALVYIPLRTYMNAGDRWQYIFNKFPLFLVEIAISTVAFTAWLYLIDWILRKVSEWTGEGNASEFRLSNQLITLVPAIILAVIFDHLLATTWGLMNRFWTGAPRPSIPDPFRRVLLNFLDRGNQALTILSLIAAYYLHVNNQAQEQVQKLLVDSEKMEKEAMRAQFLALKNQISPHFLFNNLSVLASLVETHPEKSAEFVQGLSSAYRYILEQSELDKISLREEMKFLETYTFLLATRFKDKVILDARIPAEDLDKYSVVPLSLQLLVENAVKHNAMSKTNPLVISVIIENGTLTVSNLLQPRQVTEPTTKLGLNNIISRYKLLQKSDVVVEKTDHYFTVKIPLIA